MWITRIAIKLGVNPRMQLNVRIESGLCGVVADAVSFETGLTREQTTDPALAAYEHHGTEFNPQDRGALPAFFEDLILGRPMPDTFATRCVQDVDTLVAIALFLHRDLAINAAMATFVYQADFVHRLGLPALAHVDEPLARFFSALRGHFPDRGLSQRELSERIVAAVEWIREYVHGGAIPVLGPTPAGDLRLIDQGDRGFVLAQTSGSLWDAWVELYRFGFLRGILIAGDHDQRRLLIAKKSHHVVFDLARAAQVLNQMEISMGEPAEWRLSSDGLWLESPKGTPLLLRDILAVLTRV